MRDDRPGHPWLRMFLEAEGNKTMALNKYRELIARLCELRDAPEPMRQDWWDHEAVAHQRLQTEWRIQRDLATELLAMLGEE